MKELILHNKTEEISKLSPFIEEIAEEYGIDAATAFNLNLCVEEAVSNVINYAYPADEDHTLSVSVEVTKERITTSVTDEGMLFDPVNEAPQVDVEQSAEERPVGGLGIFLIRNIMDEVSYKRELDRNILTMIKNLE